MDLETKAKELDVTIVPTPQLRPDLNAIYLHRHKVIFIQEDLDPYTARSALAHEIGHAIHKDEHSNNPRTERRADTWAAQALIAPDEYRDAERLYGPHVGAIAWHLGVTRHLVEVWRNMFERTSIA
ncbi:ImmA/IrrE family metallo-endopeptidase [Corynebacterium sp. AOP12-C2-36]|uniref:ImmA/IrrE family metallo-endopeptidase n=1 Tax=Corynebacterium sp. AOP12-C2-36 TaxID=3457723 RepID=UPI0040331CFA